MQNLREHFKQLEELTISEFNPSELLDKLIPDDERFEKFKEWNLDLNLFTVLGITGEVSGLVMKLDHKNFEDLLFITKSFMGFYNVHYISTNLSVLHTEENILEKDLFNTINKTLERVVKVDLSNRLN
jgi:hypothetical protein